MLTHLVITLGDASQDARDLYSERGLTCAGCDRHARQIAKWVLPGLCSDCALRVESVTAAAPRTPRPQQGSFFETGRRPG